MEQSDSDRRVQYFTNIGFRTTLRWAALLLFALLLIIFATRMTRVADADQQRFPDPFSTYSAVLPGQRPDIASLEIAGFSCQEDTRPTPADIAELCSNIEGNEQASAISVALWDGRVEQLDLKLRREAFAIGDLALLWGNPEIQQSGHWVSLRWHERHISASGWSDVGQFTYFQPVLQLSFG